MIHKAVCFAALFAVICTPFTANADSHGSKEKKQVVAAEINGEKVYRSAVEKVHMAHPQLKLIPLEAVYERLLEHVVDGQLLISAAEKSGVRESEEVKKAIAELEQEVIRRFYLEQEIDKLVTDEKLKALYDDFVKANPPAKEVHARHILLENEVDAKAVIDEIKGGADFESVAKEKSTGPSAERGGDLGFFTKDAMVPEFADAAFAMKKGEVSEKPVKSQFGWHVIKVEDTRVSEVPSFKELKPKLAAQFSEQAIQEVVESLRGKAKIKLFNIDGTPLKKETKK